MRFPRGARATGDPQGGGSPANWLEKNQLRHLRPGLQHEAMHYHRICFSFGARTTGDPRGRWVTRTLVEKT
eukprot:7551676-Pyramimonas_sp.AAC.2